MKLPARQRLTKEQRKKSRHGTSLLESAIQPSTLRRYREAVYKALEEWNFGELAYNDVASFDLQLGDYLEFSYENGESVSFAGDLISGLQTFLPFLRKHLPYSWHLFGLWRKSERSWQATPLGPDLLWAMIARSLEQSLELSFLLAAGFYDLLRTGELLQMRFEDITSSQAELIVHLPDTKTSASGGPGEMIVIRDQRICQIWLSLKLSSKAKGLVWRGTATAFRQTFNDLICFFKLENYSYRPYSLRRGGATALYRDQTPMDLILIRGRWKNASSARVYISDGMTEWARLKYSPKTKSLLKCYHKQLGYKSS